jgi:hypothetical protein
MAVQDPESGKIKYIWVPLPSQVEVEEIASKVILREGSDFARSHKILLGGAAGPGKSTGGRKIAYRRCLAIKNFECLILRESFPELERSHLRRMKMETDELKSYGLDVEFTPSKFVCRFPSTGSIIELGHMEDEAAVRKYLSTEYDMILGDECVKYAPKALMELIGRGRTVKQGVKDAGGPLVLLPTNPGGPAARLLRDLCIDHTPDLEKFPQLEDLYFPDEWSYVAANLDDNPYLDPMYEADLAINQPWRFKQLRYNDWDVLAGQFFETFRGAPTVFA